MRVERIELIGFKSFSEKTIFNFHPGITAIVGPNGCGKSNIVDAVKWVLGEQSVKSLRGKHMEDVIFAGSQSKKPKGMAEATLIISETNNGGSSENGGISVTRRLYRSGESEYLMNKVQCRLKDIKDVFLDTGLEIKSYSILEQDRMDVILNSKPEDRRFLIEEVAGVMKYKVRKAEAIQKLEVSQINLQRLQDIITEVKRQINSIDRHARRAEKYKKLFEEIKDIELRIASRDVTILNNELLNLISLEDTLKSKEVKLIVNIRSSDALIEEKKLICLENEKKLGELNTRLYSLEKEITEGDGKIALSESECENLKERLQRLHIRNNELTVEMESITVQSKEIENNILKLKHELSSLEEALEDKNNSSLDLNNKIVELENTLENKRIGLFSRAENISTAKNGINSLTITIENISKKENRSLEEIDSLRSHIISLDASIKGIKDRHKNLEIEIQDKIEVKERLIGEINKKKEDITGSEENIYRGREELAGMTSRLQSLKELDKNKKEAVDGRYIKMLCQVADMFESPPEYETAIEAVLGEKLSAIVVDDYKEIKNALKFIKEHKIERSAFIPASTPHISHSELSYSATNDVIGRAIDFVKVKDGFEKLATFLLGNVFIVNNLNMAFDLGQELLLKADGRGVFFVTVDGDVFDPSGVVFGGIEKGVLKIKREIKELGKNIENKKTLISSAENKLAALKDNVTSCDNDIISLNNDISSLQRESHEVQLKILGIEEEKSKEDKRLEYLSIELDADKKEKDMLMESLNEKTKILKTLEKERLLIENEMRDTQQEIAEEKDVLETLRIELTETKLAFTALKEKIGSLTREKDRLDTSLLDMEKKKDEMLREHSEIEQYIVQKEKEIKEKKDSLKSSVAEVGKLQVEILKLKEILEGKTAELSLIEKQQKSYTIELESIRKELANGEVKKTGSSLRLQHIMEDIKKSYGIVINPSEQWVTDETLSVDEESLPSLREKLQEIGPVNLGTLEEFEELKIRYEFLTKQQNDLIQSINSLRDTISKINRTTQSRLREAFEALNEKFKEVFAMLFGRGRAELILTSDDILESGIDIVAQPPGKKLQNLMLLSGGEKALVALSLLFAGFMIKPTPLCILDEVDAPLDESNTDRFGALLKELAKNIQFITITHNRRTMEIADYIYGITMEEPGISKVISMHMAEAM